MLRLAMRLSKWDLVKLYRITNKKEYLETAKYFIEERGHFKGYDPNSKDPWKNGAYWQDHIACNRTIRSRWTRGTCWLFIRSNGRCGCVNR